MNFTKYFLVVVAIVLVLFSGQSDARNIFKKIGKGLEGVVQRTRDASFQAIGLAQAAANVAATARQG